MNEIPFENRLYLVAGGAAVLGLSVFFFIRFLFDRYNERLRRRLNGIGEEDEATSLILQARNGNGNGNGNGHRNGNGNGHSNGNGHGLAYKIDKGFGKMVQGSGLDISPDQYLGWTFLAGVALAAGFYFLRQEISMIVVGLLVGSGILLIALYILQSRHRRKLLDQLPDAIYLLARSLRAGLSLDQAIHLVGEQGVKPIATEFARCDAQIRLGLSVPVALENMSYRLDMIDFNALVSTVGLYTKTGGNLPMLLDRLAVQVRDRNQFRGYVRTATAMGRITSICLGCAAPVFLLAYMLVQPDYVISFLNSSGGWIAMLVAFTLEVIGGVWLYRLLQIDY